MGQSYQKLEFNGKLYVDGIDRSADYDLIFPEKPKDKSILDIGCHMGYYVIRSTLEGAYSSVGIERNREWADMGLKVMRDLGIRLPSTIIHTDALKHFPSYDGLYDITLCLNFFHHIRDIEVIKKFVRAIDNITTERMVFCVWPPSIKSMSHSRETYKGRTRTRLNHSFFAWMFPKYLVTAQQSIVSPERLIVEVRK